MNTVKQLKLRAGTETPTLTADLDKLEMMDIPISFSFSKTLHSQP